MLVGSYTVNVNGSNTVYTYTYDEENRIESVKYSDGKEIYYHYDNLGQLVREDNQPLDVSIVYEYDNAGNIVSKKTYQYCLPAVSLDEYSDFAEDEYEYESDGAWGDLLVSYNGNLIDYDNIGNPTQYRGYSFTWTGRQLTGATKGNNTYSFTYNSDGIRTSKTVNGVTTNYYLCGSTVVGEETNGNITLYLYDSSGIAIGFIYHGSNYAESTYDVYFYGKNLQGDIVAIYGSDGTKLVNYSYDAYGNFDRWFTNGGGSTTAINNNLTYRGYYYDTETGLYYVSSRYYDPEIGRWINADGYISTGNGVLEKNMFAYCLNNPVNMVDPSGEIAITTLILIGSIVAGVAVSGYTAYTSHKYTGKVDWNNTILSGLSTFAFCYTYGMSAYGMYVSYCDYKGYTPVTNIGSAPKTNPAPYSNLQDPSNVAPGKDFTASQKAQIIQQNKINNNGVVKSDLSGKTLVPPQKSMKGVTPPANEWQIDHIIPKSAGGTNSFSNAQVLSREENRIKWDH